MLEISIPSKKKSDKKINVTKNSFILFKKDLDQLLKLHNQGNFQLVVSSAYTLLEKYPDSFFVWNILGSALKSLGKLKSASKAFNRVIQLNPNYADGFNNIGTILIQQGKINEAIIAYEKAIFLNNNYVVAYVNFGNALRIAGKHNEAIKAFNKALLIDPNYIDTYIKFGLSLLDQDKIDEAKKLFKRVISYDKENVLAHFNLGQALLKQNFLKEGLELYEWRWKLPQFFSQRRNFSRPIWDGKVALNSKRLLLWSEQGIGDTLSWSSYLPIISSKAHHCILECQEKIVPLLQRSFPNIEVKPVKKLDPQEKILISFTNGKPL